MSLMTALYSGASGLDANSTELSVVGDNISNANTIGFKGSRAAFADAMAQNLIGSTPIGAGQRGLGVKLQMVQKILSQGSLVNTGVATDLGIEGAGFFAVRGQTNGKDGTYYTRAGQFTVDQDGYLVNLTGLRVQGYTADSTGALNATTVGDLQIGNAGTSPRPTENITLKANLQADAVSPVDPFDPADAPATSNFASSTTVFDSLGRSHQVDIYFRKEPTSGDLELVRPHRRRQRDRRHRRHPVPDRHRHHDLRHPGPAGHHDPGQHLQPDRRGRPPAADLRLR